MIRKSIKNNDYSFDLILEEPIKEIEEDLKNTPNKIHYFKLYIKSNNNDYKLGGNFNLRKNIIKRKNIPIFQSESKKALEYIYNMINEENIYMFNLINLTYSVDDSVIDLNYDKYIDLLPEYSKFMVFMEYITNKENVYSYLINNLNSFFFQSDLHPEINTLSIITRFIDYNFPKEEIVYLFKKAITLKNQIELDDMLNSSMVEVFSYVNPEEFNTLEIWEKVIFYRYCGFFISIDDNEVKISSHGSSLTKNLPLSFLPGVFVTSLYELKKQNKSILPIVAKIKNADAKSSDLALIIEYIIENTKLYSTEERIKDEVENLFYYLIEENGNYFDYNYEYVRTNYPYLIKILKLYVSLFHTKEENSDLGIILMINVFAWLTINTIQSPY